MHGATDKQHAHDLIERLEQAQIPTAVRFLEFMLLDPLSRFVATAPVDDEAISPEEEQALQRADEWLKQMGGHGIPHQEVLAEFELTMDDFPLKENGA